MHIDKIAQATGECDNGRSQVSSAMQTLLGVMPLGSKQMHVPSSLLAASFYLIA